MSLHWLSHVLHFDKKWFAEMQNCKQCCGSCCGALVPMWREAKASAREKIGHWRELKTSIQVARFMSLMVDCRLAGVRAAVRGGAGGAARVHSLLVEQARQRGQSSAALLPISQTLVLCRSTARFRKCSTCLRPPRRRWEFASIQRRRRCPAKRSRLSMPAA